LATDLSPAPQSLDPDELIEIVYLPFGKALELVHSGQIEDSKTIIALLLAAERV